MPPVLHVDSDAPLYDDEGKLITDEFWGNYFKQDLHGVQGGAAPVVVGETFDVDPYPTAIGRARPSPTCGARRCRTA